MEQRLQPAPPAAPQHVATCTRNANAQHKAEERKPAKLWESQSVFGQKLAVSLFTHKTVIKFKVFVSLSFSFELSLASLPLSFLFVFVFVFALVS